MQIKRQQYLNALLSKKDNGRVKIITGIRRCGKSYLLFELFKNHLLESGVPEANIIEMALDEVENIRYRNPFELNDYIKAQIKNKSEKYYILIDEIQFCSEEPNPYVSDPNAKITFVDTVLGLVRNKNLDIYITGSNSKMLSKDVLTQFRDRGDEIHVLPLSFAEAFRVYRAKGMDKSDAWREYCTYGGMPFVLSLETEAEKNAYLKTLFQETYLKDIIERGGVRSDLEVLETLLDFVSSAVGSLTNPLKLEKRFLSEKKITISHSTVSHYLDLFIDAYILTKAQRYDIKGAQYFDTPLKYYYTDIGLRNARLNFRQIEETHIMENIIYNDLLRRGYNVDVGVVQCFKRVPDSEGKMKNQRAQLEVDFVVNRGSQRVYIQSALHIDDPEKMAQETNSLNRINDSFKKIVILKDNITPWVDEKGIMYIGVLDFLMNENAIDF